MSLAMLAASVPVERVGGRYQAVCQYPREQWPDCLVPGLIDLVSCALLRQRKKVAEVYKSPCHSGGSEADLTVTLYRGETGQDVHPEKVIVCHRGGGLFHVFGKDSERVRDVTMILSRVFV